MVTTSLNQIFSVQQSEIRNSKGLKRYVINTVYNKFPKKRLHALYFCPVYFLLNRYKLISYCERSEASEILLRWPYTVSKMGEQPPVTHFMHAAVTLFDVLYHRNCRRQDREILTQSAVKSSICAIKIQIRYL